MSVEAIRKEVEQTAEAMQPIPLPDSLPPVAPFDPELLPEAIRDHVMDVADRQQGPADFVAVAAICGLSALLGRKVLMRPKQHDDWTVTPTQWGAIIGRPSAMKSPSLKEALRPLATIERVKARLADLEPGRLVLLPAITDQRLTIDGVVHHPIRSIPRMYGSSTSGTVIEPSSFR